MKLEEKIRQQYKEYEEWLPLLLKIDVLLSEKRTLLVAIDGDCGSGKTTCGNMLQQIFEASLFHMDDYYLPIVKREENWREIPAANMDLERFEREVLQPAKEGRRILYRPYNCQKGNYEEPIEVRAKKIILVEGSYCQHPKLRDYYDLKIVLTCSEKVQKERLQRRERERFSMFQECWIPLEQKYHKQYQIREQADFLFDTDHIPFNLQVQ